MASASQSNIAIATTTCWPMAARLALEFRSLGAQVRAICLPGSPVTKVGGIDLAFGYSPFDPIGSLRSALRATEPDLIIPCDDRALTHLHAIHSLTAAGDSLRRTIERSLGDPAGYAATRQRGGSMAHAAAAGIREPATRVLTSRAQVIEWCAQRKLPAVLKADGSWGGNGVVIVRDEAAAVAAFDRMTRPIPLRHVMKCLISESDPYPLHGWLRRERAAVVGQDFVQGYQANIMAACWRGEVVASAGAVVLETTKQLGAATIIRPVTDTVMRVAAERLVRRLGLSGFCGIDFVIERGTGEAYMIELNPRPTQLGHLALGHRGSLVAALLAKARGEAVAPTGPPRITQETVAFFPQAWVAGTVPDAAFRDIPWEEPALLAYLLRRMGDGRGFRQRLADRVLGRRSTERLVAEFTKREARRPTSDLFIPAPPEHAPVRDPRRAVPARTLMPIP